MRQAFFGRPQDSFVPGGAHVAVYVVPVFAGQLLVFDVDAPGVRGRWLPWTVLEYGANPYETAAALGDDWCEGAVSALEVVDVLSFPYELDGWELALVFRALLTTPPGGDAHRRPVLVAPGRLDAIGPFDPVDLLRWVERGAACDPGAGRGADPLVF
ncbi:MAG: hypothetical protein C4321_08485 [Chloroflexota bacterium]